jgi:hypothetical protein
MEGRGRILYFYLKRESGGVHVRRVKIGMTEK